MIQHLLRATVAGALALLAPSLPAQGLDTVVGGWTRFEKSADTRVYYVSASTGNDANDGLSPDRPKRTIMAGVRSLRRGFPDWLLLRRGDTWQNESFDNLTIRGRSIQEPILISDYGPGTERPLITSRTAGISTYTGSPTDPMRFVAFVGLRFEPYNYSGVGSPSAIGLYSPVADVLVEDCYMADFYQNIIAYSANPVPHRRLRFRRNIVVDAYNTQNNHAQGAYFDNCDGLLLEQNLFDHNGWREGVPGAAPTIFRHNIYCQNTNANVEARGNIIARGASHGIQMRSGGIATDNLMAGNSLNMLVGGDPYNQENGVLGEVRRNVFIDSKDISPSLPRGWGLALENIRSATVDQNLFMNRREGQFAVPLTADARSNAPIRNLTVRRNIISDWGGTMQLRGSASLFSNVTLANNVLQNRVDDAVMLRLSDGGTAAAVRSEGNEFFSSRLSASNYFLIGSRLQDVSTWRSLTGDDTSRVNPRQFAAPNRDLARYDALLGGPGSVDHFLREARKQSRFNWRDEYSAETTNDWLRQGFSMWVDKGVGHVTRHGTGCDGREGRPVLVTAGGQAPTAGEYLVTRMRGIGADADVVPFVILGRSRTQWFEQGVALPMRLDMLGMPGCSLHVEPFITSRLRNYSGQAAFSFEIPDEVSMAGTSFFLQGYAIDSRANALGVSTTAGLEVNVAQPDS